MDAHVVSIKNCDRRPIALKRAKECGLKLLFHDAVDLTEHDINSQRNVFNISKFFKRYGRYPASGEIGVLLSHYALWKKLSKEYSDPFYLILEDDFIPKTTKNKIVEILEAVDLDFDIMILGYSKVNKESENVINIINPIKVLYSTGENDIGIKFRESTCGMVAYIVSANFVKEISRDSLELPYHLSDDWSIFKQRGFKILHVTPLCFREDFLNMDSFIEKSGRLREWVNLIPYKHSYLSIRLRFFYRIFYGYSLKILMFFKISSSS
jgi:glycosyl transferase, family 25